MSEPREYHPFLVDAYQRQVRLVISDLERLVEDVRRLETPATVGASVNGADPKQITNAYCKAARDLQLRTQRCFGALDVPAVLAAAVDADTISAEGDSLT